MIDISAPVLIVAAHPDDEALGCGGTVARLAALGADVHVIFMTNGTDARIGAADGAGNERQKMGDEAARAMGARSPIYLSFPDNRMDGIDLLDVAMAIEREAASIKPATILTHAAGDLNVDHRRCAQAVITAFRPVPGQSARTILGFEVASSSEWAFGVSGQAFQPSLFIDISDFLEAKIAALRCYDIEMRDFPHVRSYEGITALARWRGSSAGIPAAEAFDIYRSVI